MQKLKVSIIFTLAAAGGIAMSVAGCRTEEYFQMRYIGDPVAQEKFFGE